MDAPKMVHLDPEQQQKFLRMIKDGVDPKKIADWLDTLNPIVLTESRCRTLQNSQLLAAASSNTLH